MSWFNRIRSATSRLASNTLSGARRLASNITPESVQRRITDFGNWLTGHVGPDQTPQVLNEIVEHVRTNYPPRQPFEVRESNSALRHFARVYTIDGIEGVDARSFLNNVRENITRVLWNNRRTKVKSIFRCWMERPSNLGETVIKGFAFHSNIHINLDGTDEDDIYIIMTERLLEKMATCQNEGSGWRLYNIINLELHTISYTPLRGETWIPLPKELDNKKAIINMKNNDDKCFLWCVLRVLNPKDNHPERVDKELKLKENTLNMDGIEYPVSLKDIDKFEKQNPTISITVFDYKEKGVHFLRNSDNMDREHKIVLRLIEKDGVKHYCLVKNISRLLSSQASKHNGITHHKVPKINTSYDPSKPSKYLTYLDANNLYGAAMSMKLPTSGFKWMNKYELNHCEKYPCILEVDLEYPKELHDLHNDYPLAPERIMMCKNKVEKLIPNLRDKKKYIIPYKNLEQYLNHGLELTCIHRGIKFEESEWLKPYIDKNTKLRAKANNKFEREFFKLMNNSVFGKTMENIRNRVNIK